MRRNITMAAALAVALVGLTAGAAQAVPVTQTYNFAATGAFSPPGPFDDFSGSVTVTYDTDVTVTNQTTGITLNSLSFPIGSAIAFNYDSVSDELAFGGSAVGVAIVSDTENDFYIAIQSASGTPTSDFLIYMTEALGYSTTSISVTTGVPEPGSLVLFGAGLMCLGLLARRHT